jgi:hypothetical protein
LIPSLSLQLQSKRCFTPQWLRICPRLMTLIREWSEAMAEGDEYLVMIRGAGARRRRVLAILAAAKVSPWDDTCRP